MTVPDPPKPWMDCPSVRSIREDLRRDSFQWPQKMDLLSARALIRKGNPRPAPGPDRWEKWMVKSLHDFSFQLVVDLWNYCIESSHFPSCVKPSSISLIHKRGDATDLANFRGVCTSSLCMNMPFAWLNSLLTPYLAQHSVLPEGQIATQPGVQGRDLTSLLAQLETWADRTKTPLYTVRRDQKKGFDRLEPQGFYDAIMAYGLPSSIIDFDVSAQSDVPYRIKTFHGLTDTLTISGITKQGGPLSPIKCTLTSSLGSHWLSDSLHHHTGHLRVATLQASRGQPHLPDDRISMPVVMVEAMDDSAIVTTSLPTCLTSITMSERFQSAYGGETNWPKSAAFLRNVPNPPSYLQITSVHPAQPEIPVQHDLSVSTSHIEFLRLSINDPSAQYHKLKSLISSFDFPSLLNIRLPLPALRRVLSQCLVSKIRPHLAYQPISETDAIHLDHLIAAKVHEYFSFPFYFNSGLLSLPLSLHGFNFPSVSHLNRVAAMNGLLRDLNHHIGTFRNMAHITLADWTCQLNHCVFPLHGASLNTSFMRQQNGLPFQWRLAHDTMRKNGLSIRNTDLSFLFHGDVSLRHLNRTLAPHLILPPQFITNLANAGLTHLFDIASFSIDPFNPTVLRLQPHPNVLFQNATTRAQEQWLQTSQWLSTLTLKDLVNGFMAMEATDDVVRRRRRDDGCQTRIQIAGTDDNLLRGAAATQGLDLEPLWFLGLPPRLRMQKAHDLINAYYAFSPHKPFPSSISPGIFASDASMLPAAPSFRHQRSVTLSSISHSSALAMNLDCFRTSAWVYHGETYGLIASTIHQYNLPPPPSHLPSSPSHYTDHLNSSRIIDSAIHLPPLSHQWSSLPGRSLYRWLLHLLQHSPPPHHPPNIIYTPAHTNSSSTPSTVNALADHLASGSQYLQLRPPPAPLPTFFMDSFMLYSPNDGYVETSISSYLPSVLTSTLYSSPDFRPATTMLLPFYDQHTPPEHPYLRASSAYSALVQLYARSDQLDTTYTRFRRFGNVSPMCVSGCDALETVHHVFVSCSAYHTFRQHATQSLITETSRILDSADVPLLVCRSFLQVIRRLFEDGPSCPNHCLASTSV